VESIKRATFNSDQIGSITVRKCRLSVDRPDWRVCRTEEADDDGARIKGATANR
jgi:hypothetical protein